MHSVVISEHSGVGQSPTPVPLPCGILVIEGRTAFDLRADGQTRFLAWGTNAHPRS